MPTYRSRTTTHGRNMAGARGLWRATGMKDGDFGKPIIAVVNSFTQFVPGHVHLKDLGQLVAREIEAAGGVAKEFNTIAVDDGIAMGHDGMLYSLPSRELIADSRRIHGQRALRRRHGLHLQLRQDHARHADGGAAPQYPGRLRLRRPDGGRQGRARGQERALDLVDAMVAAADDKVSDEDVKVIERSACPTCGSCSGMFTANSMNCLTEALGLSLPGNGSMLATHADRKRLFVEAGHLIVDLARRYYEQDDESVLPRSDRRLRRLRERHDARHRHGRLDQHRAASAGRRARGRDRLHHGRHRPRCRGACRCCARSPVEVATCTWRTSTAPAASWRILGELDRGGLLDTRSARSMRERSAMRSSNGTWCAPSSAGRARVLPCGAGRRADAGGVQPGRR